MKKILSLLLAVMMCFAVATTLISCGHEHAYKTEWSSDADNHWHDCTDPDCTEPADKAAHSWDAGTVKSFVDTEYACTVCGYKKTVSANTVVSATQWTAAMDLGENYSRDCDQKFPGTGVQVFTAKRAGNLFASSTVLFYEGQTEAANTSYNYGKIENNVFYRYTGHYSQDHELLGYHCEASEKTVQEEIDDVLAEFLPASLRDMTKYTHNTATGYYECAEAEAYSQTVQNVKLGFKDAKLVYITFGMAMDADTVLSVEMDITYGGATVTLPAADQMCNHN